MKPILIFIALIILQVACSQSAPSEEQIQTAIAKTQMAVIPVASATATNTSIPATSTFTKTPTKTTAPSRTPGPTNTPRPTSTKRPTSTPSFGSRFNPAGVATMMPLILDDTKEFSIWIEQAYRGKEAWQMIKAANRYNDPAPDEQEYVLLFVRVVYTNGAPDELLEINRYNFKTVSDGSVLDIPFCVVPDPEFDVSIFPSGKGSGWVCGMVYIDDPKPLLVLGDPSDPDHAFYFSLAP